MKYNERKEEQRIENEVCTVKFNEAMQEFHANRNAYIDNMKRLRSCTAWVFETQHYYILQSYSTCIAVIEKAKADTCYDVLRKVYGYTATSAQHVSKFDHDYGSGKWGCDFRRTWRNI